MEHLHEHGGHIHSHGTVDGHIIENKAATRVLLISLLGLLATALFQAVIVFFTRSTALLADTIHNFGDSLTSIPLWVAFVLSRRPPTRRFTYGFNRSEDLAGLIIILVILFSAVLAGYESVLRLVTGVPAIHLQATAIAAIIGFAGNELVAIYRIRMGKRLGSAALAADGHHARIDGWTSLAVLGGVIGTWLGYPIIDPLIGLLITIMILFVVKDSAKQIFTRLLDGIEPDYVKRIEEVAAGIEGVLHVGDVKARWFGHRIIAELSITVASGRSIKDGHDIAKEVIHRLQHEVEHLSDVQIHVDPFEEQGASFHTHESLHAPQHHHTGRGPVHQEDGSTLDHSVEKSFEPAERHTHYLHDLHCQFEHHFLL